MAATNEPKPTRGVAMAAPAVDTVAGAEDEGFLPAAVEEGAGVVREAEPEIEWDGDSETGAEGAMPVEEAGGAPLPRGAVAVDSTDEAGGADSGAELDGTGGAAPEEAGGGAYDGCSWEGVGAGKPCVAHSVMVEVTVTVTPVPGQAAEHVSQKLRSQSASKLTLVAIVGDDSAGNRRNREELLEAEHGDSCEKSGAWR
jgi:hypothetical protein